LFFQVILHELLHVDVLLLILTNLGVYYLAFIRNVLRDDHDLLTPPLASL
jgi:hypothetical protein